MTTGVTITACAVNIALPVGLFCNSTGAIVGVAREKLSTTEYTVTLSYAGGSTPTSVNITVPRGMLAVWCSLFVRGVCVTHHLVVTQSVSGIALLMIYCLLMLDYCLVA